MKITLAKKSGKKRWMLDLGLVDGKRQREFFETEGLAGAALKSRQLVIDRRGKDALALPSSDRVRYIDFDKWLKDRKTTLEKVKAFWDEHATQLTEMNLADAVLEFIEVKKKSGKRGDYINKIKSNLNRLCGFYPDMKVSEMTREQIEICARAGKKPRANVKSLATVRSRIIDSQTFFNFCIKRKWCLKNPASEIEKIQLEDKPPGIHTVEEVEAVLKCALEHEPSLIGYLAVCYFAGLRPSEARSLKAEQIHDDVIEVTGPKAKTRRRRFIPINDTLKAWLAVKGVKYGTSKRSRKLDTIRWILGGKKTGFKKQKPKQKIRIVTGFPWPHDVLRHSFCSYGLPKFGATKIAEWAGHSERILFAHYRERVKPTDSTAYWALRP